MDKGTPEKMVSREMALLRANMHILDNRVLFSSMDNWWTNMQVALQHRGYDMRKLKATEKDLHILDLYLRHLDFTCTPTMQSFFITLEDNIMKRADDTWNVLTGLKEPTPCCSSSQQNYYTNQNTLCGVSVISADSHRLKSMNFDQAQQIRADQIIAYDVGQRKEDPLAGLPNRRRKTNLIQEEQRLPYNSIVCEDVEAYPSQEYWHAPVIQQVTGNFTGDLFTLDETYRANRQYNAAQQFSPSGSSIVELLHNTVTKVGTNPIRKPRKAVIKKLKEPINDNKDPSSSTFIERPVQKRTRQRKQKFSE